MSNSSRVAAIREAGKKDRARETFERGVAFNFMTDYTAACAELVRLIMESDQPTGFVPDEVNGEPCVAVWVGNTLVGYYFGSDVGLRPIVDRVGRAIHGISYTSFRPGNLSQDRQRQDDRRTGDRGAELPDPFVIPISGAGARAAQAA